MYSFILFIHVLSALVMGFYLVVPFLTRRGRVGLLSKTEQQGLASVLFSLNRIGQYFLIIAFLSGGYLVGKGAFSTAWMIAAVVLAIFLGAMGGMMSGPLKRWRDQAKSGKETDVELQKIRLYSLLAAIGFLAVAALMVNPQLL